MLKFGLNIALVLGMFLVVPSLFAANLKSCRAEYDNWISKYASSSPLLAHNKSSSFKFEKNKLLTELYKLGDTRSVYLNLNNLGNLERLLGMRKLVTSLVDNSAPSELIIVLMGVSHTLDAYLYDDDFESGIKPIYARAPLSQQTKSFSQPFRALLSKYCQVDATCRRKICKINSSLEIFGSENIRKSKVPLTAERATQYLLTDLARFVSNNGLNQNQIENLVNKLFTEELREQPTNVILIGEWHNTDASIIFEELPSAECLKILGFTKVKIALEGIKSGTQVMGWQLNEYLNHLIYINLVIKFNLFDEMWFRYFYKDVFEELEKDGMCNHPNFLALSNYGISLEKNKVPVEYIGIDTKDGRLYGQSKVLKRSYNDFLEPLFLYACISAGFCLIIFGYII